MPLVCARRQRSKSASRSEELEQSHSLRAPAKPNSRASFRSLQRSLGFRGEIALTISGGLIDRETDSRYASTKETSFGGWPLRSSPWDCRVECRRSGAAHGTGGLLLSSPVRVRYLTRQGEISGYSCLSFRSIPYPSRVCRCGNLKGLSSD
jgi:hypothetical protein